jgi:hypothetical protein
MPDGYELVPVGDSLTNECLVKLSEGWKPVVQNLVDAVVRAPDAVSGYLPFGYYCRPIKEAKWTENAS